MFGEVERHSDLENVSCFTMRFGQKLHVPPPERNVVPRKVSISRLQGPHFTGLSQNPSVLMYNLCASGEKCGRGGDLEIYFSDNFSAARTLTFACATLALSIDSHCKADIFLISHPSREQFLRPNRKRYGQAVCTFGSASPTPTF